MNVSHAVSSVQGYFEELWYLQSAAHRRLKKFPSDGCLSAIKKFLDSHVITYLFGCKGVCAKEKYSDSL